jgi:hypothetical protein
MVESAIRLVSRKSFVGSVGRTKLQDQVQYGRSPFDRFPASLC